MSDSYTTKSTLAASFKRLMAKRPFHKISVGDICSECGMNRKSFYYHFKDKYDLTNWIFIHEFVLPLNDTQEELTAWDLLQKLFDYFYENSDFYRNALSVTGQNCFHEYFREFFCPQAEHYLEDALPKSPYKELTIRYFSDAVIIATFSWLNFYSEIPPASFFKLVKDSIVGFSEHVVRKQAERQGTL